MIEYDLSTLFIDAEPLLSLQCAKRGRNDAGGLFCVHDLLPEADCLFVRGTTAHHFRLKGSYRLLRCDAGGWFFRSPHSSDPSYWFPGSAVFRLINGQGHILDERHAALRQFGMDPDEVSVSFDDLPEGWILDFVVWKLDNPSIVEELQTVSPIEIQGYFLLGSHTRYDRPSDIYRHIIHGWVYEDRYAWPHKRRVCSENDAHALYLICQGLQSATGKRIYALLKYQLLLSVLSRQGEDGGFRHGEWTDQMESHYRLHCSGMHLMMEALASDDDPTIRAALSSAAAFIADKCDTTDLGTWFFHDELETTDAHMSQSPFKWWPSKAFGKARQNMLVLNTHLDAAIALQRYGEVTGDRTYTPLVESAFKAAQTVLALRPLEWLYRLVFSAIDLTLLPTERAIRLPRWKRLWKRIGWQVFVPRLPRLKTRFPRLTMPGGYIDRELSLQTWAHDYLAVNLMDLVRADHRSSRNVFAPYIKGILGFCVRTDIMHRWLEQKPRTYAVAFYAEALVLLAVTVPSPEHDAALAAAIQLCAERGLGLPPSINGGNSEVQPLAQQVLQTRSSEIAVVNLSSAKRAACLVVNLGTQPIRTDAAVHSMDDRWALPRQDIPPGGWVRIEA